MMDDFKNRCFVCGRIVGPENLSKNKELNLPVCSDCKGSDREKEMVKELTTGLADGFVCGCI
jgi:hypothetical protein